MVDQLLTDVEAVAEVSAVGGNAHVDMPALEIGKHLAHVLAGETPATDVIIN